MNFGLAQNPVVIELFTSQGCSSCPSADKNLAEIIDIAEKNDQPVYGLSFHVDYWNYIGWKDPFSRKEFTERQKKYASIINPESVYTPQMIINGKVEFVGSDRKTSNNEVIKSLQEKSEYIVSVTKIERQDGKILVSYALDKAPSNQVINVALVEKKAGNEVTRGENSGKKLMHRNVVRSFASAKAKKEGIMSVSDDPKISEPQLIVFIQNEEWRVTGAIAKNF